ncbi:hypothetical protein HDU76_012219 [Blyttiomyces sp. JEL0837]|nr:hypothetical protein HDU76_012219 [Blyttiomyces sp. JEL0837]
MKLNQRKLIITAAAALSALILVLYFITSGIRSVSRALLDISQIKYDLVKTQRHQLEYLNTDIELLMQQVKWLSAEVQALAGKHEHSTLLEKNLRIPITPQHLPTTPKSTNLHLVKTIRTIYGLWDNSTKTPKTRTSFKKWQTYNPTFKQVIHTKLESDALIEFSYPWLRSLYESMEPIHQSNLLRLLFVHAYGGLYTDIDVIPSASIEDALRESGYDPDVHNLVVFTESILPPEKIYGRQHAIRQGVSEVNTRICNYLFYGSAGSEALMQVIFLVAQRLQRYSVMSEEQRESTGRDYSVLYVSGPDAFTEAVFGGPGLSLLPGVLLVELDVSKKFWNEGVGDWRVEGLPEKV